MVSAAKNIYAISATQWFAPKSMNDATERIVTYGAVGYYFTPIYIRMPQNIPRIIFSNHKLEILVRVIAAAPTARDAPRGVAKSRSVLDGTKRKSLKNHKGRFLKQPASKEWCDAYGGPLA